MRPVIDGELERLVRQAAIQADQDPYEFVRDATRQQAEQVLDHE